MSHKKEIEERIEFVSDQLLREFTTPEIWRNMSVKWDISKRQVERYIRRCYDLWHKDFEKKRKRKLAYHLAKRADLYKQAYNKKQWNICLDIIKDEAKLSGSYPAEKHKIEETREVIINIIGEEKEEEG